MTGTIRGLHEQVVIQRLRFSPPTDQPQCPDDRGDDDQDTTFMLANSEAAARHDCGLTTRRTFPVTALAPFSAHGHV
jgi:hypothetical protein